MYQSDPTLIVIRERHQELIRQSQHYKLAHETKSAQPTHKAISPLRAILVAIINLVMR